MLRQLPLLLICAVLAAPLSAQTPLLSKPQLVEAKPLVPEFSFDKFPSLDPVQCSPEEVIFDGRVNELLVPRSGSVFLLHDDVPLGESHPLNYKLMRSDDDGVIWQQVGQFRKMALSQADDRLMYFINKSEFGVWSLWRSFDNGDTIKLANGKLDAINVEQILPDRFDRKKVYLFSGDSKVWISNDYGTTFTPRHLFKPRSGGIRATNAAEPYLEDRRIWDAVQDPREPGTFYVVSEDADHTGYGYHPRSGSSWQGRADADNGSWEQAKRFLLLKTTDGWEHGESATPEEMDWHAQDMHVYVNPVTLKTDVLVGMEGAGTLRYRGAEGQWYMRGPIRWLSDYIELPTLAPYHIGTYVNRNTSYPNLCTTLNGEKERGIMLWSSNMPSEVPAWFGAFAVDMPRTDHLQYNYRSDTLYFYSHDRYLSRLYDAQRDLESPPLDPRDNKVYRITKLKEHLLERLPDNAPSDLVLQGEVRNSIERDVYLSWSARDAQGYIFIAENAQGEEIYRSYSHGGEIYRHSLPLGRTTFYVIAYNARGYRQSQPVVFDF